jgi:hypothetical protein
MTATAWKRFPPLASSARAHERRVTPFSLPMAMAVALTMTLGNAGSARAAQPPPGAQGTSQPIANDAAPGTPVNGRPFAPHLARFAVKYRGMEAGTSEIRFEPLVGVGEARYRFTNRSTPHGLAALFLPGVITQRTTFAMGPDGLRPLDYSLEDGGKSTARDVRLAFDWTRGRVTGVAENQPVDLALANGTQDALTVGLQVRWLLQQGRSPQRLVMVEKTKAKDYDYAFEKRERLQTALGPVDTVVWSSRRPGSDRVTRTWYAPAYGYVAVKAEQVDGGKPLMSFTITAWQALP